MAEGSFPSCVLLVFGRILKIGFADEATFLGARKRAITLAFPFNFCQPFLVNYPICSGYNRMIKHSQMVRDSYMGSPTMLLGLSLKEKRKTKKNALGWTRF